MAIPLVDLKKQYRSIKQEIYKDLGYHPGDFPIAEEAQNEVLSLLMCPELTDEQIQEITEAALSFRL